MLILYTSTFCFPLPGVLKGLPVIFENRPHLMVNNASNTIIDHITGHRCLGLLRFLQDVFWGTVSNSGPSLSSYQLPHSGWVGEYFLEVLQAKTCWQRFPHRNLPPPITWGSCFHDGRGNAKTILTACYSSPAARHLFCVGWANPLLHGASMSSWGEGIDGSTSVDYSLLRVSSESINHQIIVIT